MDATDNLTFGEALGALKRGQRVARSGWNDKGMLLVLVEGWRNMPLEPGSPYADAGLKSVTIDPHIDSYTALGTMQPGWVASQADLLADDWQVVI